MKEEHKHEKFTRDLIESIMRVFSDCYQLHARGESETSLLIQHDIYAAGNNFPPYVVTAHRKAVKSAVCAVDTGIPYEFACGSLLRELTTKADQLLREDQ